MDNSETIFPASENIEKKSDRKTWFWEECLNVAKESGCKVGTIEFWVIYKIRVYETHGKYGFCVASEDTLAEDLGISPEQARNALDNACRARGKDKLPKLLRILCDKKVYRNKTKIYVTRQWLKDKGISNIAKFVENHGIATKTMLENPSNDGNNPSNDGNNPSNDGNNPSNDGKSPLMNKYKRMSKIESNKNESIVSKETKDKPKKKSFVKPTLEEIRAYCQERNNCVDAEKFYDYYESKGWLVGRTPMKNWQAAVRNWERNNYGNNSQSPNKSSSYSAPVENVEITSEVEDAYKFWRKWLGVSCPKDNENVQACKSLLEDVGEEGLQRLIVALAFRGEHGYLTKAITDIVDFVGLQKNSVAVMAFYNKHQDYWRRIMKAKETGRNVWEVC